MLSYINALIYSICSHRKKEKKSDLDSRVRRLSESAVGSCGLFKDWSDALPNIYGSSFLSTVEIK